MADKLFREVALERQSSPERLDSLMRVTSPASVLALAAVGLVILAAGLWGVWGDVPVKATGRGRLLGPLGLRTVAAPVAGVVGELSVVAGAEVCAGDGLLHLDRPDSSPLNLTSPVDGRVLEASVRPGDYVAAGTPLLILEPTVGPSGAVGDLQAVVYVSADQAAAIEIGMVALVQPVGFARTEYGALRAYVVAVAEYPTSLPALASVLGDPVLAGELSHGGAPVEVRLALLPAPATPSGYAWTGSSGPGHRLKTGLACTASVAVARLSPLVLVFPFLTKYLPEPE